VVVVVVVDPLGTAVVVVVVADAVVTVETQVRAALSEDFWTPETSAFAAAVESWSFLTPVRSTTLGWNHKTPPR
jgi:hypothetical protein